MPCRALQQDSLMQACPGLIGNRASGRGLPHEQAGLPHWHRCVAAAALRPCCQSPPSAYCKSSIMSHLHGSTQPILLAPKPGDEELAAQCVSVGRTEGCPGYRRLYVEGSQGWGLGGEDPWRRKWTPIPVFLPGKSHGQRSLAGYSPWGCKESDMTE